MRHDWRAAGTHAGRLDRSVNSDGEGVAMGDEEQTLTTRELAGLADMRSRAYAFLSNIFFKLPDEVFVGWLRDGSAAAALDALGAAGQDDMAAGLALVKQFVHASRQRAAGDLLTDLVVDRTRLLKGIRPGLWPAAAL